MAAHASMASTATTARVRRAIWARIVSTRSTSATRIHARMARHALKQATSTNVTVPTATKASNAKTLLTGALSSLAKMARHAFSRRIFSDASADQAGRARCAMLRMFRAVMRQIDVELTRRDCVMVESVRTLAIHIGVTASVDILDHIVRPRSTSATHRHAETVEFVVI